MDATVDLAHLQKGTRLTSTGDKITTLATAAAIAKDEVFDLDTFADGAIGLRGSAKTPTAVTLNGLGNDGAAAGEKVFFAMKAGIIWAQSQLSEAGHR